MCDIIQLDPLSSAMGRKLGGSLNNAAGEGFGVVLDRWSDGHVEWIGDLGNGGGSSEHCIDGIQNR